MRLWRMDKITPHLHTHTHTHTQVGTDKVRPALTLVGYEDELRPAMAYVFGSMFVCDTLQNAKKVHTRLSLVPRPRGRREHGLGTRLVQDCTCVFTRKRFYLQS